MENGEGIRLELILKSNGDVTLNGPLGNKMLCFYILEMARNALHQYKPEALTVAPSLPKDLLKHLGPNGRS